MKNALVVTVGTTIEFVMKTVMEAGGPEQLDRLVLVYGRLLPGQKGTPPAEIADAMEKYARGEGVDVLSLEIANPESVDDALEVSRAALESVAAFDRITVQYTGGTKVMSVAIVYAALTEQLAGELLLQYTGGANRTDDGGRARTESMSVITVGDAVIETVLAALTTGHYGEAHAAARRLPNSGPSLFVKHAAAALHLWDEFDYRGAFDELKQARAESVHAGSRPRLTALARAVERLERPGGQLQTLVRDLESLQNDRAGRGELPRASAPHAPLLVADALENARRRLRGDRPTDAVLRAYRAVEVAVQMRLLANRVNPWNPDWNALGATRGAELTTFMGLANLRTLNRIELGFAKGLKLLQAFGEIDEGDVRRLEWLAGQRNLSYLEHGYTRLQRSDAERAIADATAACDRLCSKAAGARLEEIRQHVSHDL